MSFQNFNKNLKSVELKEVLIPQNQDTLNKLSQTFKSKLKTIEIQIQSLENTKPSKQSNVVVQQILQSYSKNLSNDILKEFNEISKNVKELCSLTLNETDNVERNKINKQVCEQVNQYKEKFLKTAASIQSQEKQLIQDSKQQKGSPRNSQEQHMLQELREDDLNEKLINQRQDDLNNIEGYIQIQIMINFIKQMIHHNIFYRLVFQLRDLVFDASKEIQKQGMMIDTIYGNIKSAKENVVQTNKEIKQSHQYESSSTSQYVSLLILFTFILLILIMMAYS